MGLIGEKCEICEARLHQFSLTSRILVETDAPMYIVHLSCLDIFKIFVLLLAGYYSWRRGHGSWFIQSLCSELRALWNTDTELCRILTRVNHEVAYNYESMTPDEQKRHKKQMPSIVSMLTKDLYFTK